MLFGAFICFAIAIFTIIAVFIFAAQSAKKPKKYSQTKYTIKKQFANSSAPVQSQRRESKLEQSAKLDILHQQFRDKKPSPPHGEKREISVAKFRKLAKIVNGQQDVAQRLIEGNLKLFPDKSPDWACDKAISDIERDRR